MSEIGKRFIEKIDALAKAGKFYGFSIWPSHGGYQVNLATSAPNNWRVRTTDTPSEGIDLVCAMDYMDENVFATKEPEMLAPPAVDEPPLPDEWLTETEIAHAEAGIFD